jgi:hypothetical protein
VLGLSCVVGMTIPADDGYSFGLSRIAKHQNLPAGAADVLVYSPKEINRGFWLPCIDDRPFVSLRNDCQLDSSHEVFSSAKNASPLA